MRSSLKSYQQNLIHLYSLYKTSQVSDHLTVHNLKILFYFYVADILACPMSIHYSILQYNLNLIPTPRQGLTPFYFYPALRPKIKQIH